MSFIVYYDFTSAESFALNEIVRTLSPAADVAWRGVHVDPAIPTPMPTLDRSARGRVEAEIADVARAFFGAS